MSTALETETGLEVFEQLKEMFSEEAPCEGEGHGKEAWHPYADEPGEWYLFLHCPGCNLERVSLLCNTGKKSCDGIGYIRCRSCRGAFAHEDIIKKFVRKGATQ